MFGSRIHIHSRATATPATIDGTNTMVRNRGTPITFWLRSRASSSDVTRPSGTPSATKYAVLPKDFPNTGSSVNIST